MYRSIITTTSDDALSMLYRTTKLKGYRSWKSGNLSLCPGTVVTNQVLLLNRLAFFYFTVPSAALGCLRSLFHRMQIGIKVFFFK